MGGTQFLRDKLGPGGRVVRLVIDHAPGKEFLGDDLAFQGEHAGALKVSTGSHRDGFPFFKGILETFRVGGRGLYLSPGFLGVPGDPDDERLAAAFRFQALIKRRFSHGLKRCWKLMKIFPTACKTRANPCSQLNQMLGLMLGGVFPTKNHCDLTISALEPIGIAC